MLTEGLTNCFLAGAVVDLVGILPNIAVMTLTVRTVYSMVVGRIFF
jgi:hypothetical protein